MSILSYVSRQKNRPACVRDGMIPRYHPSWHGAACPLQAPCNVRTTSPLTQGETAPSPARSRVMFRQGLPPPPCTKWRLSPGGRMPAYCPDQRFPKHYIGFARVCKAPGARSAPFPAKKLPRRAGAGQRLRRGSGRGWRGGMDAGRRSAWTRERARVVEEPLAVGLETGLRLRDGAPRGHGNGRGWRGGSLRDGAPHGHGSGCGCGHACGCGRGSWGNRRGRRKSRPKPGGFSTG